MSTSLALHPNHPLVRFRAFLSFLAISNFFLVAVARFNGETANRVVPVQPFTSLLMRDKVQIPRGVLETFGCLVEPNEFPLDALQ